MRKRLLPIVLVALLTIPLALVLRDFVRDRFVIEVLRVLWAGRILFESLPQWPFWVLLLAILAVLAIGSLGRITRPVRKETEVQAGPQGQVQVLARWIRRASQGAYFRWSLAQYLGGLAWDVMAHQAHTTPGQLKQRLRAGTLDLPPVVQEYLESAQSLDFDASTSLLSRLWARLGRGAHSTSHDPALESVIRFLEAELEVTPPYPTASVAKSSLRRSGTTEAISKSADEDTLEVQHDR